MSDNNRSKHAIVGGSQTADDVRKAIDDADSDDEEDDT